MHILYRIANWLINNCIQHAALELQSIVYFILYLYFTISLFAYLKYSITTSCPHHLIQHWDSYSFPSTVSLAFSSVFVHYFFFLVTAALCPLNLPMGLNKVFLNARHIMLPFQKLTEVPEVLKKCMWHDEVKYICSIVLATLFNYVFIPLSINQLPAFSFCETCLFRNQRYSFVPPVSEV